MTPTRLILQEMLRHIGYLETFVAEGQERFLADVKTQFAIRLAYELIGDMAKQLPAELLALQPQIRWQDLKGMRDVLAHRYLELDLEIIWQATEDLPRLRAATEAMLASLPPEGNAP